ncbi:hypothetical protein AB4Z42_24695 [Mycobacterium sp. 2YAF39]
MICSAIGAVEGRIANPGVMFASSSPTGTSAQAATPDTAVASVGQLKAVS